MAEQGSKKGEFRNIDDVGLSEDDPEGFVRVVVLLPDLEVSKKVTLHGIKIEPVKGTSCTVDVEERSLRLEVTILEKRKKTPVTHKLEYRILPHSIDKTKSKTKFENGRIIMLLKKKEDISWAEHLISEHGLETDINT